MYVGKLFRKLFSLKKYNLFQTPGRTLRGLNVLLTPEYNEGTRWKTNTKQLGTAENDGQHLSP